MAITIFNSSKPVFYPFLLFNGGYSVAFEQRINAWFATTESAVQDFLHIHKKNEQKFTFNCDFLIIFFPLSGG